MSLSVIIPTLNEAANLPLLLDDLRRQSGLQLEVIVCDGGSTDGTTTHCENVVRCQANRAAQMNAGARRASFDWLLFLHADSRLPRPTICRQALDAVAHDVNLAGHFSLSFVGPQSEHPGFRYLEAKTKLNRPNTTNGDQGFLVHRSLFDKLGGFDETLPFLEDQRFAELVRRVATWITLPDTIETSTRRFATEGFGRRYLSMAIIIGVYNAGVDDFFDRVNSYPSHPDARLDLGPIISAMFGVTFDRPPKDAWKMWQQVGAFIRSNAWQLALFADVYLLRDKTRRCLEYYDTNIAPWLDSSALDQLATMLAASFFLGAVPLGWSIRKRFS